MTSLQKSQDLETRGKGWSKEDIPSLEEDQFREYLSKLEINKSIGLDVMQPCLMVVQQLILETTSRLMKDRKVIRSSQHGFS